MARNTAPEDAPTSDWEHSHALQEGDELTDAEDDAPMTVDTVCDDGSVKFKVWVDQRHGQECVSDVFDGNSVRIALSDELMVRDDGKSHELAAF